MRALSVLALLAIASPAFAQAAAEKQSAPVQDQKPFLYDGLMPLQEKPHVDHPVTILSVGGKTVAPDKSSAVRIQLPPMQPIITTYSANNQMSNFARVNSAVCKSPAWACGLQQCLWDIGDIDNLIEEWQAR